MPAGWYRHNPYPTVLAPPLPDENDTQSSHSEGPNDTERFEEPAPPTDTPHPRFSTRSLDCCHLVPRFVGQVEQPGQPPQAMLFPSEASSTPSSACQLGHFVVFGDLRGHDNGVKSVFAIAKYQGVEVLERYTLTSAEQLVEVATANDAMKLCEADRCFRLENGVLRPESPDVQEQLGGVQRPRIRNITIAIPDSPHWVQKQLRRRHRGSKNRPSKRRHCGSNKRQQRDSPPPDNP